uniref:Uncharacterized protein n=1 Tax=Glossina austeni TaxID=7395 RepID=A0A1A9V2K9_GLOAU
RQRLPFQHQRNEQLYQSCGSPTSEAEHLTGGTTSTKTTSIFGSIDDNSAGMAPISVFVKPQQLEQPSCVSHEDVTSLAGASSLNSHQVQIPFNLTSATFNAGEGFKGFSYRRRQGKDGLPSTLQERQINEFDHFRHELILMLVLHIQGHDAKNELLLSRVDWDCITMSNGKASLEDYQPLPGAPRCLSSESEYLINKHHDGEVVRANLLVAPARDLPDTDDRSIQSAAASFRVRCRSAFLICHFLISNCTSRDVLSPQPHTYKT